MPSHDYSTSTWFGHNHIRGSVSNHLGGTAAGGLGGGLGGGAQVALAWRHELIDASIVRHLKIASRTPFNLHGNASTSTSASASAQHPKEAKSKALPLDTLFQQVKEALQEQSGVTVR